MDSTLPLISIITPSFNQRQFIEATIESVLAQDYPRIEYLVVDGGSTDGTLDVLRRYGDRLRWRSEPDGGQADAINKGVRLTGGEVLGWLNADDTYLPGAVSLAVGELVAHPQAALVYGRGEFMDREGRVIEPCLHVEPFDLRRLIHHNDIILQPAAFFRRAPLVAVGGLDTSLHYALDYDLWIKLALRYPVRYLPALLARARVYPETKTISGGMERLAEIERVVGRYGRRRLPAQFYGEMIVTAWRAGRRALRAGSWAGALSCWRRGAFYGAVFALRKAGLEH
jgi:glycosyltransferase involved in cell wall biosynthesis